MPDISGRGRGDELVEVVVETPTPPDARQEELLRELADIEHEDVSPRRKSFFEKLRDYFTEEDAEANPTSQRNFEPTDLSPAETHADRLSGQETDA